MDLELQTGLAQKQTGKKTPKVQQKTQRSIIRYSNRWIVSHNCLSKKYDQKRK